MIIRNACIGLLHVEIPGNHIAEKLVLVLRIVRIINNPAEKVVPVNSQGAVHNAPEESPISTVAPRIGFHHLDELKVIFNGQFDGSREIEIPPLSERNIAVCKHIPIVGMIGILDVIIRGSPVLRLGMESVLPIDGVPVDIALQAFSCIDIDDADILVNARPIFLSIGAK